MFCMQIQECKAKHDGVINAINAINALIASVKEIISKRGVIPSKRISYPYTPLEIKVAKRRRKDISRASSSIKKAKLQHLCLCLAPLFNIQGLTSMSFFTTSERRLSCKHKNNTDSIPAGFPWHLIDQVYIPINYDDEFHWVLAVVILKERRIQVYDSMSQRRRSGLLSEIQKLAKILPTYLYMSGFLGQNIRTNWSTIEAYQDKIGNSFDVQYFERISQQIIGSILFVASCAEYLSDGLHVPNDELDARLLHKIYAAILWKYGEAKAQKLYASDIKDR
ncbi:hypothetical protein BC332_13203 [Capsicum chinense]|nr:hypothetical protein BC332_13203 [Capsicum chinense]